MRLRANNKGYLKIEYIFLMLSIMFIGIMIVAMPLNRVPDESTHAVNAWRTLYTDQKHSFDWGSAIEQDKKVNKEEYKKLFTEKIDLTKEKHDLSFNKGNLQYIPQIIGMQIGKMIYPSIGFIMISGRIMNALFYIVALFFIIRYMKYGKRVLIFTSLLPISIQQAASLSYDVSNFLAISFFFSVTTNLVLHKKLRFVDLLLLFLSIMALYLTKTNNLSLLTILPFIGFDIPNNFSSYNNKIIKIENFLKKRKKIFFSLLILLLFIVAILYFKDKGGITNFVQIILNSLLNNKLNQALNPVVSAGMFGFIGIFHMQFPIWLFFIDVSVLTILMIGAFDEEKFNWPFTNEYVKISTLVFPLQVLLVVGGMYFTWTKRILGENAEFSTGTQGRYFTPFLIYLTPLFISFNHKIEGKMNRILMNKILITTLAFNFIVTIYLILLVYWYPDSQTNWLIEFRKQFN